MAIRLRHVDDTHGDWGSDYVAELIEEFERRDHIDGSEAASARWHLQQEDIRTALEIILRQV